MAQVHSNPQLVRHLFLRSLVARLGQVLVPPDKLCVRFVFASCRVSAEQPSTRTGALRSSSSLSPPPPPPSLVHHSMLQHQHHFHFTSLADQELIARDCKPEAARVLQQPGEQLLFAPPPPRPNDASACSARLHGAAPQSEHQTQRIPALRSEHDKVKRFK